MRSSIKFNKKIVWITPSFYPNSRNTAILTNGATCWPTMLKSLVPFPSWNQVCVTITYEVVLAIQSVVFAREMPVLSSFQKSEFLNCEEKNTTYNRVFSSFQRTGLLKLVQNPPRKDLGLTLKCATPGNERTNDADSEKEHSELR